MTAFITPQVAAVATLGSDPISSPFSVAVRHFLAHKTKIDRRFESAQRMSGSHPLLQVHRVIKELRIALVLSHHDGNTALTDYRNLLHYFLFKTSDLGNTPFRFDPVFRIPGGRPIRLFAGLASSNTIEDSQTTQSRRR